MLHTFCKAKIGGLRVTQAELHYEGSITVDAALLESAGIREGEKVEVLNVNNGSRIETYAIKAKKGSGCVCLNGPAARSGSVGDELIILCYCLMNDVELESAKMRVIKVNERNKIKTTHLR